MLRLLLLLPLLLTACFSSPTITSYDECVASGFPIMESYPEQCSDGTSTFVHEIGNTLSMSDRVVVSSPLPGDTIADPLTISGEARGNYYFEATFPIEVVDDHGKVIVQSYATADGEWMTEEFVPFSVTLHTELPSSGQGKILLKRSNASGLPEHDETLEIPVRFGNVTPKDPSVIEQVPSEISIDHFSKMRLEGTDFIIGDVLSETDSYTRYTVTYRSNGLLISGILNIPHGDGPFPLVVTNHGHIDRAVYTNGRGLKREQDYFARHGYTVLHPDFRGHGFSDPSPLPDDTAIYDAGLEYSMDALNGVYALRTLSDPRIDTDRVAMLGHSMGGGVTMNIAVAYPDELDAVILYAPVHTDAWENFVRWRSKRLEGNNTIDAIGTRKTDPEMWDAISSLAYLDRLKAPVLLFQGTQDPDVPKEWSDFLAKELTKRGKDISYVLYEGEKHEYIAQWNDFMEKSDAFLRKHLSAISPKESKNKTIYSADRVTKKPFGLYVNPGHSPVFPERFAGYHTGTDFELLNGENPQDVLVTTLCDGTVLHRQWVKGYGGVLVQSCGIDGQEVTVLYGHLKFDSIPHRRGNDVSAGEFIGTLGKAYSTETDGERAHLHLSIHSGTAVELRGYAEEQGEIIEWIDPMSTGLL